MTTLAELRAAAYARRAERWAEVLGFPGYEVSSLGRLRSRRPQPNAGHRVPADPIILTGGRDKDGYRRWVATAPGVRCSMRIAPLVCTLFNGPRPEGMVLRHLNGDEADDRACNLRWGTQKENIADAIRHGTHHSCWRGTR